MLDVVGAICGLHAQLMSSAELTLWARLEGLEPGAVERALWEDRTLIKIWAMRGTLHLLPAREYPLWQAALETYRHYLKGSWLREFGFTREELERAVVAIGQALDGRMLTREELAREVARLTGSAEVEEKLLDSWGATLKPASFRGLLCYAPSDGQKVRFTRPDGWLGDLEAADPESAVREVTRRYLAAFGPATRETYARWAGLGAAEAGRRIDALGDEVAQVECDGSRYWMLARQLGQVTDAVPQRSIRLLPQFDPYVIGAPRDDPAVLSDEFRDRVYRSNGWISAVLLVDGRMEGVWEYDRGGSRLALAIEPFEDLPAWAREGAQSEAERLAAFFGQELELTWRS